MKGYRKIRKKLLEELQGLPPNLTYHGFHHTLDVVKVVNGYIQRLKLSHREAYLLRIAALAHDIGFIVSNLDHEAIGANMTEVYMKEYGFSQKDIEEVKAMIIATKPANPSKTKLEKILCDADLDYLGRKDFEPISNSLYKELTKLKLIKDYKTWMKLQVKFLESHEYQTTFARKHRAPMKAKWLQKIKESV